MTLTPPADTAVELGTPIRFPLFDSLRAIAALSVFGFHVSFHLELLSGDRWSNYLGQLNIGVAIFFVISGFLLYRPFAKARLDAVTAPAPKPYAIRRTLRIVPAYWVALPIITVMLGIQAEVFTPTGIVKYFGFLQIYDRQSVIGGIGQAWTLCVEVTFYVMVPLWAWWLRRLPSGSPKRWLSTELAMLAGLAAFSILWKIEIPKILTPDKPLALSSQLSLPGFADYFAIGMAIAVLSVAWAARPAKPRIVGIIDRMPWLPWLLALIGFAILGYQSKAVSQGWGGNPLARHELKGIIGGLIIIPAVWGAVDRGWVRRLLGNRWLLWLGVISYAFYLWHLAWIFELADHGWVQRVGWGGTAAMAFVITVAVSLLSWYLVERPGLRLARRLTGGRKGAGSGSGLGSDTVTPGRP